MLMDPAVERSSEPESSVIRLALTGFCCSVGAGRPLFEGLSLELPAGAWMMLTGPNGSGKTTLLRAVAGLSAPTAGAAYWRGRAQSLQDRAWPSNFFYLGHKGGLKAELTAAENLKTQVTLDQGFGVKPEAIRSALERVGLTRVARVLGSRLSAGQTRRLALARLLFKPRPLWLLDEPANALDQQGMELLGAMIDAHLNDGGSALVATHQPLLTLHAPLRHDIAALCAAHVRQTG